MPPKAIRCLIELLGVEKGIHVVNLFTMDEIDPAVRREKDRDVEIAVHSEGRMEAACIS